MRRIERKQVWQEHITDWGSSGLSAVAYCKQHSLGLWSVHHLAQEAGGAQPIPDGARSCGFARVKAVSDEQGTDGLTVSLPGGVSITGLHGGNIELLGAILRQL
jgi:hypothetical protein